MSEDRDNKKSSYKYLREFPDFEKEFKDYPNLGEVKVHAPVGAVTPITKFSDLLAEEAKGRLPLRIEGRPYSSLETPRIGPTASAMREVMGKLIAREMEKRRIDPVQELPAGERPRVVDLPDIAMEEGVGGFYDPSWGGIMMRGSSDKESYYGDLAHEIAHKSEGMKVGYDQLKAKKDPRYHLQGWEPEGLKYKQLTGPNSPTALVNYYYGSHHRADFPEAYEVEALKNLEKEGRLTLPMTKEASPKYQERIRKLLRKK